MPPLRDDLLPLGADPDLAHAYIKAHDERAEECNWMRDGALKQSYNYSLRRRGMTHLSGMDGWSHDELVNSIVDLEFPDVQKAREIWYRHVQQPREIWYRHVQQPAIGQE